jgi:salicylate biosynthesis isochorismate synthase
VQQASNLTGFAISTDRGHSMFLGATPETLLKVKDGRLTTHALAGTLAGDSNLEHFMASSKLRQEHAFVSDGVSATLAPFTTGISAQPLRIRRSGTVTHLETPLAGQLRDDADPLRVLKALHPTPAIGGWPRAAAMKALETLEPYSRGWFAAPVGWLAANGDAHAAIAIRSQWVNPDRAVMLAGAGIVKDSLPNEEWSETENKFDNMRCMLRGQVHDD